jgi:hypothetical protein
MAKRCEWAPRVRAAPLLAALQDGDSDAVHRVPKETIEAFEDSFEDQNLAAVYDVEWKARTQTFG